MSLRVGHSRGRILFTWLTLPLTFDPVLQNCHLEPFSDGWLIFALMFYLPFDLYQPISRDETSSFVSDWKPTNHKLHQTLVKHPQKSVMVKLQIKYNKWWGNWPPPLHPYPSWVQCWQPPSKCHALLKCLGSLFGGAALLLLRPPSSEAAVWQIAPLCCTNYFCSLGDEFLKVNLASAHFRCSRWMVAVLSTVIGQAEVTSRDNEDTYNKDNSGD